MKYTLYAYLFVLVLIIGIITAFTVILNLKNDKTWYFYRLGDVLKSKKYRKGFKGKFLHYMLYPNSIAVNYMKLTDEDYNYDIISKLVTYYKNKDKPSKETLIIHIRAGDVIEQSDYTVDEHLSEALPYTNKIHYVKPLSYFKDNLKHFKGINEIVLISGGCHCNDFTKSKDYVAKLSNYLTKQEYKVTTRFNGNPDDDFVYMCNSTNFISSGGGFSFAIKNTIKYLNSDATTV